MRSRGVRLVEGAVVLGVETSCDDTGVGVVDVSGRVRGEALHSQLKEHQKYVYFHHHIIQHHFAA